VPDGDLLVHAGDLTLRGERREVEDFNAWLEELPHRHKIVVAGNHDWVFEREPRLARSCLTAAAYLEDSAITVEGLRVYGSPWQPWFMSWAFNLPRGRALREKWASIPAGTDLLLTHAPPRGVGDRLAGPLVRALSFAAGQRGHAGCRDLLSAVRRVRPRLHVFGHIHEGYGTHLQEGTIFVNASCCDAPYRPLNAPVVVDL
jgi:Icc-related predicted phosphoesterase